MILNKNKKFIKKFFNHTILIVVVLIFLFPLVWLFMTSVKIPLDVFSIPPVWIPKNFTFETFREVIIEKKFYLPMVNTIITSLISTGIALMIGSIAAYGLLKHRYSNIISIFILMFRMIPQVVLIIPLFLFFTKLELIDTRIALIITFTTFQLPFIIWLMKGFFSDIPKELEESAKIDGCSATGALVKVIFPIAVPGLAAAAILTLIISWNEYMFSVVITRTMKSLTMPVAVNQLVTFEKLIWTGIAAESVLFTIPILVIAIIIQKYIVRGITLGAVKG